METEKMAMQSEKSLRLLSRVLCTLLALLVLLSALGVFLYNRLNRTGEGAVPIVASQPPQLSPTAPPPTPDPFAAALDTGKDYYETGELQEVPIYEQKQINRFIISILVVIQNGSLETENPQTDMMFIVSYSQIRQQFTVVSLMRDTLVPMGDRGWKRLNSAYAYGGMGLLINTLNDTFGLDIQNYVYTGTEELGKLADLVGGVPMELTEEEAAYINAACGSSLSAGQNQLTGEQALLHLGNRTSGGTGDFGRVTRQLTMIRNMFQYLKDSNDSSQMRSFFATIFKSLRTNLDFETLAGIGYEMCMADALTMQTIRFPFDESYTETSMDGAFALIPEIEKNRILLMQALYSKE